MKNYKIVLVNYKPMNKIFFKTISF